MFVQLRDDDLQKPASISQTQAIYARLCFFVVMFSPEIHYSFDRLADLPAAIASPTAQGFYSQARILLK